MKKLIPALILMSAVSACSSVTIRDESTQRIAEDPTWSESQPFFFWGIAGEKHLNVNEICQSQKPVQMQTQMTFLDGFLRFITLGIYAPRTAHVWCQ